MDKVIKQISEIEAAASSVMDEGNSRKKAFTREMEENTASFDKEIEEETEGKIQELRARMEIEMHEKLAKQKVGADHLLTLMETNYEEHHAEYVKQLFQSLIEE